jgi:hypothetical protein
LSRRAAICILAVVLWAGCRRSTGPDANYQRAFSLYQQLYATQLDDAYGDPRMDEVVALLRAVDSRSSDAQPAQNLLGTIQRGKDALVRDRAEREKATAAVRPPAPVTNFDTSKMFAALEADAGTQGGDPFGPGASLAELTASSGGCLAPNEPFTEQGTGVTGTVYRAVASDACKTKLPGLSGQIVLVVNNKVYRRMDDPRPPPAAPAPGAQAKAAPPAAKPAAKPADTGSQYHVVYPGQPVPEGMVPASPPQAQQQ